MGEVALIANGWVVVGLLTTHLRRVAPAARPLLYLVLVLFLLGMGMATASNSQVSWGILPWHAAWHVIGAFGFIALWLFNHERFGARPRCAA